MPNFRNLGAALRHYNDRERFHLVRHVIGLERQSLPLGRIFREELADAIGAPIPRDAYAAFDYQLNRLEDALYDTFATRAHRAAAPFRGLRESTDLPRTVIDIDLLVVFERMDSTRIAMVEAKYQGAWNNTQLAKKAEWLSQLFRSDMVWANMVTPSFVMLSKRPPAKVDTSTWPDWMAPQNAPLWMELH